MGDLLTGDQAATGGRAFLFLFDLPLQLVGAMTSKQFKAYMFCCYKQKLSTFVCPKNTYVFHLPIVYPVATGSEKSANPNLKVLDMPHENSAQLWHVQAQPVQFGE